MSQRFERGLLFPGRAVQGEPHVCMANIRRKIYFGDVRNADPGVGHFITDDLLELFADGFGEALVTVGVQI